MHGPNDAHAPGDLAPPVPPGQGPGEHADLPPSVAGDSVPGVPRQDRDVRAGQGRPAGRQEAARPTRQVGEDPVTLLDPTQAERLLTRWREIQADFVDDPTSAVSAADDLVSTTIRGITEGLERHTAALRTSLDRDGEIETEALRQALRGYRTLLDHLLA